MASVRKREWKGVGGKSCEAWVVEYTDSFGNRRRKTPKSGLKKDAEAIRRRIEGELDAHLHVPASQTMSVSDALDAWLSRCEQRVAKKDHLKPLTLKNWNTIVRNHIRPALGRLLLTELTVNRVQSWIDDLAFRNNKPVARPTIRNAVNCLSFMLKFSYGQGWIAKHPIRDGGVRIPGQASPQITIPTKDVVRRLLENTKEQHEKVPAPYLRPIVHVAVFCGLRMGEIRALSWENIDFEAGMIRVRFGIDPLGNIDLPKTKAALRDVPMPPVVATELKRWHMACGRPLSGLAFTGRGKWLYESALSHSWRRLQHRVIGGELTPSGVPRSTYNFHSLRHVYASLLIESGLPPKRVQYLMGHTSIKITFDRYGHLFEDPELVRDAMSRVGAALVA